MDDDSEDVFKRLSTNLNMSPVPRAAPSGTSVSGYDDDTVENGRGSQYRVSISNCAQSAAAAAAAAVGGAFGESAGSRLFHSSSEEPAEQEKPSQADYFSDANSYKPFSADGNSAASLSYGTSKASPGVAYVKGKPIQLPVPASYSPSVTEEILEDDKTFTTRLRFFAVRKLKAAGQVHLLPPTDLIGRDAVTRVCTHSMAQVRMAREAGSAVVPWRVIAQGPPTSGVSSTAALLTLEAVTAFQRGNTLHNHLLLAFDFGLLLPPGVISPDIPFLFQVVIRSVMDAVAVQRPALRNDALLLAELWDRLITRQGTEAAPDFLGSVQVATLVGHKVLGEWSSYAKAAYPILRAACADPRNTGLRDAALGIILHGLPATIAASLRFAGTVTVLDGLAGFSAVLQDPLRRPHGDIEAMLKPLWADPRASTVVAWPANIAPESLFLPGTTDWIKTLGLVETQELQGSGFPAEVRCQDKAYPVSLLLGAPGYVALLTPLVRSFREQRRKKGEKQSPYAVRVDHAEVRNALESLQLIVSSR